MTKSEVLKLINENPSKLINVKENLYHGKAYIVIANGNRIDKVKKTKRGAEGYIKKQSYVSYYDDYTQDMVDCGEGLEIFEVKESELVDVDNKKYWNNYLKSNLGFIQEYFMYDSIIYNAKKLEVSEEVLNYIKESAEQIKTNNWLPMLEEENEVEEKEIQTTEDIEVVFNEDKNGIELYFSSIPSVEVRTELKSNSFRWNRKKGCWYVKDSAEKREFIKTLVPQEDEKEENIKTEDMQEVEITENIAPSFENVEIIDIEEDKEILVKALEPNCNKNDTVEENDRSIEEYGSRIVTCKVERIVKLNKEQFEYFSNNLLSDYRFLEGQGGWNEEDDGTFLYYRSVAVVCGDDVLIIDPEGFSYARYCNILVEDINNNLKDYLSININVDNNEYNNALESIKNEDIYNISISKKDVINDNRYIYSSFNGKAYVTGKTVKELLQDNKAIDILKISKNKINKDELLELLSHRISLLIGTEEDEKINNIDFIDRLNEELKRSVA